MTTFPSHRAPTIDNDPRPTITPDLIKPATVAVPSGISIEAIAFRLFIILLAIACGTVVAIVLGFVFGFIQVSFC